MGNNNSGLRTNEETARFVYPVAAQQDLVAAKVDGGGEVPLMTGPPDMNTVYRVIEKAPQMADDLRRLADEVKALRVLLTIAMVASLLLCLFAICFWACCYRGRRRSNKKVFYDGDVSNTKRGLGGGATQIGV